MGRYTDCGCDVSVVRYVSRFSLPAMLSVCCQPLGVIEGYSFAVLKRCLSLSLLVMDFVPSWEGIAKPQL